MELVYPVLAKEAFEAATTAAHAALTQECALRLREIALAPPYRIAPAKRVEAQPMKRKRKIPWAPNIGEWYERRARTVGACLVVESETGRRRSVGTGEVMLVAVDENGELLDRLRCRWLLTNIRSRSGLSGRVSNHDLDSKIKELARLEEWLRNVRCEAIAVGACSLLCRRVREEVSKSSKHPFRSPCLDIQLPGKTEDCECDHIFMCMCMCCCMCMYVHLPVCAFGSSSM